MDKEELLKSLKPVMEETIETIDEKNRATIKAVKDELSKEIDDKLAKSIEEKNIHSDAGDVSVGDEEEPYFLKTAGEFYKMVHKASTDTSARVKLAEGLEGHWKAITKAPTGANTIVNSEGGFIPTAAIAQELKSSIYDAGQLLKEVTTMPLGGNNNRFVWNEVENEDRSTAGSYGGITAYRVNEGETASYSKPTIQQREVALSKMMVKMAVSEEMMQDAVSLGAWMKMNAPMAFNKKVDNEIIRGIGGQQCQGITTAPSLISISAEGGQATDTIIKENIEKMYDSLAPEYANGAKFYINPHAHKELRNMTQAVGTGGAPVYLPEGSMAGQPHGTLLGLPVVRLNACSKLGDLGDIILANMKQYLIVEKGGVDMAESMHVLFSTAEDVFRFTWRINGMPLLSSQITPENANSGDKLSSFVALAAR